MNCLNLSNPTIQEFLKVAPREAVLADILDGMDHTPTVEEVKAAYDKIMAPYQTSFSLGTVVDVTANSAIEDTAVSLTQKYNYLMKGDGAYDLAASIGKKNPGIQVDLREVYENEEHGFRLVFTPKFNSSKHLNELFNHLHRLTGGQFKLEFISTDQAVKLFGDKGYSMTAAIKGNTIYAIKGKLTDESLMEEFFHPFVEAIFQKNRPLFNNLHTEASLTLPDLKQRIDKEYASESTLDREKELVTQGLVKAFRQEYDENSLLSPRSTMMRLKKMATDFLSWIDSVFKTNFVEARLIPANINFKTLAVLLNTKGLTVESAVAASTMYNKLTNVYDILKGIDKTLKLATDGSSYEKDGIALPRLTEWMKTYFNTEFKKGAVTKDFAESFADSSFKKYPNVVKNGYPAVKFPSGKISTREEIIAEKIVEYNTSTAFGTIVHLTIEKALKTFMKEDTSEIQQKIDKLAAKKVDQNEVNLKDIKWIQASLKDILKENGINITDDTISPLNKDKMLIETKIYSDILKVATTLDGVIIHANNSISIKDWKTGSKFEQKADTGDILAGIADYSNAILNNKVDRAKLEVVFRAMMIKEHIPEAYFKDLSVVALKKIGGSKNIPVNIIDYITLIDNYFLKTDPETHAKLKDKGLLDPLAYGTREIVMDSITHTSDTALKASQDANLTELVYQINNTNNPVLKAKYQKKLAEAAQERLSDEFKEELGLQTDIKDIGMFKKLFGNFYSVGNPLISAFSRFHDARKFKYIHEREKLFREFNKLQELLIKDWKKSKNPSPQELLSMPSFTEDNRGLYNFMWIKKDRGDISGYFRINENDNPVEWAALSPIQKEYLTFRDTQMKEIYAQNMGKVIYQRGPYSTTQAELLDISSKLEDDFEPRVYATPAEMREHFGYFSKESLDLATRGLRNIITKTYKKEQSESGIPVKYLENPDLIGEEYHTFNGERNFKAFMENQLYKKHLDDAYSVGEGISIALKTGLGLSGNSPMPNLATFLDTQMKMEYKGEKNKEGYSRNPSIKTAIKVPFTDKVINLEGNIQLDSILSGLQTITRVSSMFLKPVAGAKNTAYNTYMMLKTSAVGNIAKSLGVKESEINVTLAEMRDATAIAIKESFISLGTGNGFDANQNTKLGLLLRELDFRPDNYDYGNSGTGILSEKFKELKSEYFYAFHKFGENLATDAFLIALLKKAKNSKTGKSMWDSYEVDKDGNLNWVGGIRGVDVNGNQIEGITAEESTKFKRATQMIYGSYRDDERMVIESTMIGKYLIMFKKYMPVLFENIAQSRFNDRTIGNYVIVGKNADNLDILQWKKEMNEGKIKVLLKMMNAHVNIESGNPDYLWQNLSSKQKIDMIDLAWTTTVFTLMSIIGAAGWDDDEENEYQYRLYVRFKNDLTQGLWPGDVFDALQNPSVVLPKIIKITGALSDFLLDGLIMGERTKEGTVKGWNTLRKHIPGMGSIYELEQFLKDTDYDFELGLFTEK